MHTNTGIIKTNIETVSYSLINLFDEFIHANYLGLLTILAIYNIFL